MPILIDMEGYTPIWVHADIMIVELTSGRPESLKLRMSREATRRLALDMLNIADNPTPPLAMHPPMHMAPVPHNGILPMIPEHSRPAELHSRREREERIERRGPRRERAYRKK